MATASIRTLLEAGVHFGHQTRRWNPKMKPYIFGSRNGIYILDLKQTLVCLDETYSYVRDLSLRGGKILFVGTKKQAQAAIREQAERCGMPYVNNRWLGGMLTNFVTIRSRIKRMQELQAEKENGIMATRPKKEQAVLSKELEKLELNLTGIADMTEPPAAIFVIDTKREEIAIREARRLGIPVIGVIDTNADPDEVDYPIPANDDAIRAINLISELIADAVLAGSATPVVAEEEMAAPAEVTAPAAEVAAE